LKRKVRIRDRREFPRYPADLTLEVKRERSPAPGLNAGVFEGQCIDLSRAGARFRTRELFHRHENLILTFFSPAGNAELCCEIKVLRSVRRSRQYEVAGQIVRMIPVDEMDHSPGEGN